MSINLLFSNPQEKLTPMNMSTWNSIAGPGTTLAVSGTANEIDVVTQGGTATVSLPNSVVFPSSATVPILNVNNSYTMPSNIGAPGQILSVPTTGSTLVWANDIVGNVNSVTSGNSNVVVNPTSGNVVVSLSENVNIPNLTINSSYVMPSNIGTPNQILSVPNSGNTLVWSSDAGGTVDSVTSGNSNVVVNPTSGNVVVSLSENVNIPNLTINSSYVLPSNIGNVGDTLVVQSGTNVLEFAPNEGSGVTSLTAGQDGNINLDANTGDIIIQLSNAISVNGLTLNSKTFQNPTTGTPEQKLALDANNNMVWIDDTAGGVSSISCSDGNIIPAGPSIGNVSLALNSTVNIQNLEINGKTFENPTSGGQYQALTLDANNDMIWSTLVNTIAISDNNITVDNPTGAVTLGLASSISVTGITINGSTFESPQNGNVADVLALDANKNMVWVPDTAGTGVASINNSDGNISVSNPTGTVTLDLATSIAVENITIGLAPNNYTMPSSIGAPGQILSVPTTGSTLVWANDTQGNFTVEGTENQINANTVNDVCTLSLPNIVSFPQDVYIGTGTLNTDNITNLNGISTGSLSCSGGLSMYNCAFEDPAYGDEGYVLTIDTTANPYNLKWAAPSGVLELSCTDGNINVSNPTGSVELSLEPIISIGKNLITCTSGNGAVAIGSGALGSNPQSILSSNLGVGNNTGALLTSGTKNVLIGSNAGSTMTTSSDNICIGVDSMTTATPTIGRNVCIGTSTGNSLGSNNNSVLIGYNVDTPNIGSDNQLNINNVLKMNTNGNIIIGEDNVNISSVNRGSLIVSIGDGTLTNIVSDTNSNMVAIGANTGNNLTTGNYNCLVGNQNLAFGNNVTPNNNVVIGNFVGETLSNGTKNIVIGNLSCNGDNANETSCNNNIVIGNNSCNNNFTVNSANNVIIGNNADVETTGLSNYLSISTNVPVLYGNASQLQIPNFKNIWNTNPTGTVQQFLTSDNSGNLSWSQIYAVPFYAVPNFVSESNSANTLIIQTLGYRPAYPPIGYTIDIVGSMKMITINFPTMYPSANAYANWVWIDQNVIPAQYLPYGIQTPPYYTTILGTVPCCVYETDFFVVDSCQLQFGISTTGNLFLAFLNYTPPFSGYQLSVGNYYSVGMATNDNPYPVESTQGIISFCYK